MKTEPTTNKRYLIIHQWTLDTQLPRLLKQDQALSLEPKVHQLLLHLCTHPKQIISRDDIIEVLNQGEIVNENSVDDMVSNLGQILGDDPHQPKFIKTMPKQGYSFIAPTTASEQPKIAKPPQVTTTNPLIMMAIMLVVLLSIIFALRPNTPTAETFTTLTPLTHHSGVAFAPAISADGKYLAYTRNQPAIDTHQIWLKDLTGATQARQLLELSSAAELAWTKDSKSLLYTDQPDIQNCDIKRIAIDQLEPQLVARCEALFISQMLVVEDQLYYVARVKGLAPMQLFSLDINTGERQLLKQPELKAMGNYNIDLSPDGSKLLILAGEENYHTQLYQLTLATNELQLLSQWPRIVNKMIWHHDNQSVVHTSSQYSHELVKSTIMSDPLSTLISTSNPIAEHFARHPNGRDFYFSSFMINNKVIKIDLTGDKPQNESPSAAYDKMPVFGGKPQQWFFISNRQGHNQVFMVDENSKTTKQLTQFEYPLAIDQIAASPAGDTLLMITDHKLQLLDIGSSKLTPIPVDHGLLLAANWLDANTLAMSIRLNDQTRLQLLDIDSQTLTTKEPKWQAAFTDSQGQSNYFISTSKEVYLHQGHNDNYTSTKVILNDLFGSNGLAVKVDQQRLTYQRREQNMTELIQVNLTNGSQTRLGKWLLMAGFDLKDGQLLLSAELDRSGDVLTTQQ